MSLNHAINDASSFPIQSAARNLKIQAFPNACWIDPNNRYAVDTVGRIDSDRNTATGVNVADITDYISASVTLHCFDGWSFLAHGVGCILDGDVGGAVHMAYYAELRAVMSLLASDGIGIFRTRHIWLDASGQYNDFEGQTHQVVRDSIVKWASNPAKTVRLLGMLDICGHSILDWLIAAGYSQTGVNTGELARDWLQIWSLDLNVLNSDHTVRNEASYRPQRFHNRFPPLQLSAVLQEIANFWKVCEPSGAVSRFSNLDLHLLRQALHRVHQSLTLPDVLSNPAAAAANYAAFVRTTLQRIGLEQQQSLEVFLSRYQDTKPPILVEAERPGIDSVNGRLRPFAVIARAILLLRLASAACDDLLRKSGIGKSDTAFWWDRAGTDIGLWEPGQHPDQITDLWADIHDSLAEIEVWLADSASSDKCAYDARRSLSRELAHLRDFQRVGLWAIGL